MRPRQDRMQGVTVVRNGSNGRRWRGPGLTETQVHRAVVQHLQMRRKPGTTFFHVPNGGARSPTEAAIMSGLGVRSGVPDLVIIAGGRTYGLELKAEAGKVSPTQRAMLDELVAAGAIVAVVHGLDEALKQLEAWHLTR